MTRIFENNLELLFKIHTGCILMFAFLLCSASIFCYNIEVNSNIEIVGDWDYRLWGNNGQSSRCMEMVDRALQFNVSRVQFVPTQFWVDEDNDNEIDYFCHKYGTSDCHIFNDTWIDYFREDMEFCFQHAIDNGLSIALSPHLDDGDELYRWRNALPFDPLQSYGDYTYAEILLYPLADALAATAKKGTKIWFGLQGEMGATIIHHPQSYIELYTELQNRILSNSNIDPEDLKFGLGFNFNKLCGCVLMNITDTDEYLKQFPEAITPILNMFDLIGIQNMFEIFDFVAISGYSSLAPNFQTPELQKAIYQFDEELKFFGVDLRQLMKNNSMELHLSEFGVGGGVKSDGTEKAKTEEEVAITPFFGMYGPYQKQTDPWQMHLRTINPPRKYMHYFYDKTMEMLESNITVDYDISADQYDKQYVYNIDAIFVWSQASWDVMAIYPDSTTDEGSYSDEYVKKLINDHNYNLIRAAF